MEAADPNFKTSGHSGELSSAALETLEKVDGSDELPDELIRRIIKWDSEHLPPDAMSLGHRLAAMGCAASFRAASGIL